MKRRKGPGAARCGMLLGFMMWAAACGAAMAAPKPGDTAPDFSLPRLFDGKKEVSLGSLSGRAVVVDFWASWCPPCRKTLPHLERLGSRYPSLAVVAIAIDENRGKAVDFLKVRDSSLIYLHDSKQAVASKYDLGGMPSLFLIDRKGALRYRHDGYVEGDLAKIEAQIRALMEEK